MRVLLALLSLALAHRALAADFDCTRLKSTDVPFAISYKVTRVRDGQSVAPPTDETLQVYRLGKETVTYHVFAPGKFVRNRFVDPLFPLESAASNGTILRRWSYSIDTGGDRLGRREPLDFTTELRNPDGSLFLQASSTIRFDDTFETEVGGCKFRVLRVWRTNDGTLQGKPAAYRSETWLAPDLRANLFVRVVVGGFVTTFRTTSISTSVTRPE